MIERTREDLELQLVEQQERIEYLEAQVAAMLASPKYDPKGCALPARIEQPPEVEPPSIMPTGAAAAIFTYANPVTFDMMCIAENGVVAAPWNLYPGD